MNKYKIIDAFGLKLLAIAAMTVDHIAALFFGSAPRLVYLFMRTVGAMTFPIMAFMITEGFCHTKNFNKYAKRLLLFSLASMLSYALAFGKSTYGLNVGFTLLLGLCALRAYESVENVFLKWTAVFSAAIISTKCDWGFTGVFLIVFLYIAKKENGNIVFAMCGAIIAFVIKNQAAFFIENGRFLSAAAVINSIAFLRLSGFFMAAAVICLYSGKKGMEAKKLFYIYYPAHLFVLALIRYAPAVIRHIF